MTPDEFAPKAREYCQTFSASVTSWGRTATHSRTVGGFAGDPHTRWTAIDCVYDHLPPEADRRAKATALGLQLLIETTHDHLQDGP